jgi:dual specificity MAP kinase phosphatase
MDGEFLRRNNITVVFNCTKDLPFHPFVTNKYRLPVDDNLQPEEIANMETWAPEAVYKVITEYNRGNTILIHCYAGMQRSAALVAMTLHVLTSQPIPTIVEFLKQKRPIVFLGGMNFRKAVHGFEALCGRQRQARCNGPPSAVPFFA